MVCVSLAFALPCAGEAAEVSSHSGRSLLQKAQEVSSRLANEAVVLGAMLEYNRVCACVHVRVGVRVHAPMFTTILAIIACSM